MGNPYKVPYTRFRNRFNTTSNNLCRTQYDWYTADGYGTSYPPYWRTTIDSPVPESQGVSGEVATMTDLVTPGFYALQKAGAVVFSPYKQVSCYISGGSGSSEGHVRATGLTGSPPFNQQFKYRKTGISGGRIASGFSFPGTGLVDLPLPSLTAGAEIGTDLVRQACTSALAKRGLGDSNLFETLAELDKTASLLPGLFASAGGIISRAGGVPKLVSAAGGYLAVRYGLLPVLSDIKAVVEGMQAKLCATRISSRGSAEDTYSTSYDTNGLYDLGYGGYLNLKCRTEVRESLVVRALSLDGVDLGRAQAIGLTPKGLVGLAWELIPFSFVVDWFLNIGDFLYSLIPALGWSNLGSCYTVAGTQTKTFSITSAYAGSGYSLISAPFGSCFMIHKYKIRVVGLEGPMIAVKADFRLTNILRALDALSLLTVQFGKR